MRRPLLLTACVLLAGCGNAQQQPPDVSTVARPSGTTPIAFDAQGIRFAAPGGWHVRDGQAPLVATVQSGPAQIAVWRYPRTEQLPVTHSSLQAAKLALVAQIQKRDSSFKVRRAKLLHVGPKRAVQVLGLGTINGNKRMIRSTHIYTEKAEYVVDAYAPQTVFDRVDKGVFAPVLASLEITKPRA